LAAINSTVSLYYYLRIVRQMYIEPADEDARPLPLAPLLGATLAVTVAASVLLGIVPLVYHSIHASMVGWLAATIGPY
jgi:NADH-quinone oxidoreductase subunit N